LLRPCVNKGGFQSLLQLDTIPVLEQPAPVSTSLATALSCWAARPGEVFTVKDPGGTFYRARLQKDVDGSFSMVPFWQFPKSPESPLHITVFQALPEKERFELILEKLTELGVQRIVPFTSQYSTTLAERDSGQKKSHRWPHVLLRAAKQCRRGIIPELSPVVDFPTMLTEVMRADLSLILYEEKIGQRLSLDKLSSPACIGIAIGPEGGFSPQEIEKAQLRGLRCVGLGPRILRTETAALTAVTVLQQQWGDLK